MRRLIILLAAIPFLLSACSRQPYADFAVSSSVVDTEEDVLFTNYSVDADYYEWDFGDGYYSTSFNASHYFTSPGTYQVTLSAYRNGHGVDRFTRNITVRYLKILEIEVVEWVDEYVVPNASVILYPTLNDWINMTNPVVEGFTDNYGLVVFTHLAPGAYYVDVWEEHHNNYVLADEDLGFIEAFVPNDHQINTFTAWVDYFSDSRKSKAEISMMPGAKSARIFKTREKAESK